MDESPVLVDGSLIDLCGVTLLWRAAAALSGSPGPEHLEELRMKLNAARPHCPVLLHTLAFPSLDDPESNQPRQPWVYLCCGHVHGFHPWRGRGTAIKHEEEKEENEEDVMKGAREGDKERECPLCRARGLYVPLTLGRESRLCVDAGPPSHVFVPCGHVCSEATAVYWSKTPLPCGASSFYSACPFCMKQLARDRPYVTLIFQGAPDWASVYVCDFGQLSSLPEWLLLKSEWCFCHYSSGPVSFAFPSSLSLSPCCHGVCPQTLHALNAFKAVMLASTCVSHNPLTIRNQWYKTALSIPAERFNVPDRVDDTDVYKCLFMYKSK